MPPLSNIFTIFFLTLGPIKTIPVFYSLTTDFTPQLRQKTALEAVKIATIVCVFVALIGQNVVSKWRISLEALQITGGLILVLSAFKLITSRSEPPKDRKVTPNLGIALSPLATPVIITPYGVVAILFFMILAKDSFLFQLQILGLIFLIMGLNYVGMIFADKIMKVVGFPILLLVGWIFAIMQAALAVEIILNALKSLRIIPS